MGRTTVRVQRIGTSYRYRPPHRTRSGPRGLFAATVFVVAIILGGAAAVVADGQAPASDEVGYCHATGSEEQPYVYLVVGRGSDEDRAHQAHDQDIPEATSADACPRAHSSPGGPSAPECHEGNHTEPSGSDRCDADVAVGLEGSLDNGTARFEATVLSLGPGEADNVRLDLELPDVGEAWTLEGSDAAQCRVNGTQVACRFGDLRAGAERRVEATAERCPTDCGDDLEAGAHARAHNDRNAANDRDEAAILVPDCPEDDPAPTSPQPAPPTNGSGGNATPSPTPRNGTPEAPGGNRTEEPPATGNGSAPPANGTSGGANATPAPRRGDLLLRASVSQDEEEAIVTLRVLEVRNASVDAARLEAQLPDLRRPWLLAGPDAESCTLEGRVLSCAFGTVEGGAARMVQVRAYTDRLPCGNHRSGEANLSVDDADASNNRATFGVAARAC